MEKLTLACEAHLQQTDFAIDVTSPDGQILAKWTFEPDTEYHPVELKSAPYHHTVGQPLAYYINFGGWLFWLLDEAGTGAHYDTPTRTQFMLDDASELVRPTPAEINVVDHYQDPDTGSGYRILETLNPDIIHYADYEYYVPTEYALAGGVVHVSCWRQLLPHNVEDLPSREQDLVNMDGVPVASIRRDDLNRYLLQTYTEAGHPANRWTGEARGWAMTLALDTVEASNARIAQGIRETLAARG